MRNYMIVRKRHPDMGIEGYQVVSYVSGRKHVPEFSMGEQNWFRTKKDAKHYGAYWDDRFIRRREIK